MATTQLNSLSKLMGIPIENHYDESYIIRLASMSLSELLEEPARLEMKAESLEREIQTKAIEQNEVFEKAQNCFSDVLTKINSLSVAVSTACEYIPTVEYSCKSFSKEVETTYNKYNQNKKALKYHSQLLELLEMPQLMDTCIRNNLHEEGLTLLRYANQLFCTHFPNISPLNPPASSPHSGNNIILSIFKDMTAVAQQQESLLLRELETDITVNRCLQILTYLEQNINLRCNVNVNEGEKQQRDVIGGLCVQRFLFICRLTEEQLKKLKENYLYARDQYYQKKISILSEFDHGEFLRGYISIFKEKLTNVVTQYQAVFGNIVDDIPFHKYLSKKITSFLSVLDQHMRKITSGSVMSSLFHDLIYLCDSLSLIHCNIYTLLQQRMIEYVESLMSAYWNLVESEFNNQINSSLFWMKNVYTSNVYRLKSSDSFMVLTSAQKSKDGSEMDLLPKYLMEVPLLAKLLNDFINTFNELRFVAIRGSGASICEGMNDCLKNIAEDIVKAEGLVQQIVVPKTKSENVLTNEEHYEVIVIQFITTIVPLIQIYLQRVFDTNEQLVDVKAVEQVLIEGGVYVPTAFCVC